MSTATESRIAELREDVAEAEHWMAIHIGTPVYHVYLAKRGQALRELRQMEVEGR